VDFASWRLRGQQRRLVSRHVGSRLCELVGVQQKDESIPVTIRRLDAAFAVARIEDGHGTLRILCRRKHV
jgi:hypothetical protein